MKKLFAIALTLIILLTTTACGGNNQQAPIYNAGSPSAPQTTTPSEPEIEVPSEPTREDLAMLQSYDDQVADLELELAKPIPDQQKMLNLYNFFREATWVDTWNGTQYARNREELLANFKVLRDVMLEETQITTDALGNSEDPTTVVSWNYSLDGKVIDEAHTGVNNMRVSYTDIFYENPLCIDACPVYTYDEDGKILSCNYLAMEDWRLGETIYAAKYNYNEAGQLTVVNVTNTAGEVRDITYTYDTNGLLIEVKATSFNNKLSDSYIKYTYGYDDQGRLIYREMLDTDDYTNNSLYYKWITEFHYEDGDLPVSADQTYSDAYYVNTYTNHWDYEYDAQNRLAKVQVTYGHEYNRNNGQLIREHHDTAEITIIYGDYLFYIENK